VHETYDAAMNEIASEHQAEAIHAFRAGGRRFEPGTAHSENPLETAGFSMGHVEALPHFRASVERIWNGCECADGAAGFG